MRLYTREEIKIITRMSMGKERMQKHQNSHIAIIKHIRARAVFRRGWAHEGGGDISPKPKNNKEHKLTLLPLNYYVLKHAASFLHIDCKLPIALFQSKHINIHKI